MTSCKSFGRELRLFRWYNCSAVASGFVMCAMFSDAFERQCSEGHWPHSHNLGSTRQIENSPLGRMAVLVLFKAG